MDRKKIIGVPERIEKKICVQLRIDRDELRDELLKRRLISLFLYKEPGRIPRSITIGYSLLPMKIFGWATVCKRPATGCVKCWPGI